MNLRCIFGHDRQFVAPQPGYGFLAEYFETFRPWRCTRCDAFYPGQRIPKAPLTPPCKPRRVNVPPANEDR